MSGNDSSANVGSAGTEAASKGTGTGTGAANKTADGKGSTGKGAGTGSTGAAGKGSTGKGGTGRSAVSVRRLIAVVAAAVVAACALAGVSFALPAQESADPALEYGYIYSGVKSESRDFTLAASHDDTHFLFGSSELATWPDTVSTAPDNVLPAYDCGYQFMYIGEAYDQDLWMAIAAGAYADGMPNKKLGIIISAQWFFDGGLEPGIFKMRFSYPLYDAFCRNSAISDETKAYVAKRLEDEGVDQAFIDAARQTLPQDSINNVAFDAMGDLRLRQSLPGAVIEAKPRTTPTEKPDFDALRAQALAEAPAKCYNNDMAVFSGYWDETVAPKYDALAGSMSDETLTATTEYGDFQCFLDVCRETGLEPYVIVMPVKGQWYDHLGLSREVRAAWSERIDAICAEAGVECLNLTAHEYDPYYLRDVMHFGWLGWVDVEEAFMHFVEGGSE